MDNLMSGVTGDTVIGGMRGDKGVRREGNGVTASSRVGDGGCRQGALMRFFGVSLDTAIQLKRAGGSCIREFRVL